MTTASPTMSTTPGYRDLTASRRRALCRILDEIAATKRLILENEKPKHLRSESYPRRRDALLDQADKLRESVENQFPEFRVQRCVDPKGARTNQQLRKALQALQSDVALLVDWEDREVRYQAAELASGREDAAK